VCLKLQNAITFDPKLQFESLFLHYAPYDSYFPNISWHCMKLSHTIICSCMSILEGKCEIQNWCIIHVQFQFQHVHGMILSEFGPSCGTVHVCFHHARVFLPFVHTPYILLISINLGLITISE
jgi:hypothetical protein